MKLEVKINGKWIECGEHPSTKDQIRKAQAFHKERKEETRIVGEDSK